MTRNVIRIITIPVVLVTLSVAAWSLSEVTGSVDGASGGGRSPNFDVTVDLRDGSRLRGQVPGRFTLTLHTDYGTVDAPVTLVRALQFVDADRARVTLLNGDRLTGRYDSDTFGLRTAFGAVSIPRPTVARLQPVHPYALAFDGVDDFARNMKMPGMSEHSYEVIARLVNTRDAKGLRVLASQSVGDSTCAHGSGLFRSPRDASIHYDVDIPGCRNGNIVGHDVEDHGWHHFSATFDGSVQKLYVDGVLVGKKSNPEPTIQSGFALGAHVDRSWPASVDIAEVRFWDYARSQTEIRSALNAGSIRGEAPGLVALYLLNTGHGDTAFDSSANGYHLQLGDERGTDARDPQWISVHDLPRAWDTE